ncbi:cellulase [Cercophora newfieldiana]|uniref:Glucanase n=1 Tax=Cercophora newfieldiana TaxID=92897 RepID=A0AA39YF74_9PEZI|nr:cellulase [Cercophora newfieldiana]
MASRLALVGLTALLGVVSAQKPGPGPEVHPKLITQRCTKAGGCKDATNYLVLDALSHPVHQVDSTKGCGDWGSKPDPTACPTVEACAENCIMEGIPDYSQYGVTTNGKSLRMQQVKDGKVVTPRVYLLDATEQKYDFPDLTGNEFTFDVDTTKLPCGMNSALYLSEMEIDGAKSKLNPGGAYYGTGYCDAQCFVTPFINGLGNVEGKGSCCNEMDIWEANSRSTHVAPHTCNKTGVYLCSGDECKAEGVCDKAGCGWNPYRVNITDYYGRGPQFKVDTTRKFTVITQFPAVNGTVQSIKRMYVQDGKLIEAHTVDARAPNVPKVNAITDPFCEATGAKHYLRLGGTAGMGDAISRGMTLVFSIWWDQGNMTWLDSGVAGPCSSTEGNPTEIVKVEPEPEVTFSNIKWGEIGSTFGVGKPDDKPEGKGKGHGEGKGKGKSRRLF